MHHPHPNRLLAAIPSKSRKHLLSNSEEVQLAPMTVLHEARSHLSHAFFLTSGLASILAVTTLGLSAEIGMVGREGFIESLHLIGPADTPTHCRMQLEGAAIRIPMEHLQTTFAEDKLTHRRVLEFVQAQAHAMSQVSGCHRIHGASERLTRWLLHAQNLTGFSTLNITQETLSELLGTKRVTIAAAAGELQRRGLIEYRRGHIKLLDLVGLEAIACDCYVTLKDLHRGLYSS